MTDQYLRTSEVAAELRISRQAVYNLMKQGHLGFITLGPSTKRVRRSDLDAFLAGRTTPEATA